MRKKFPLFAKQKLDWGKINADLANSHLFLNSIFENIPNMVFVKDAKDLRFVQFNKAGEDLLGFSRKSLIGKNDYDFFTKDEADFFTKKDREVLMGGKLFDIPEESIHTKNKGIRILHTKKIPIVYENGKPQYLLGISEDITEKKRLEKEVLDISEREQRRIGQDLHDGLGQHLTGIALLSKVLAKKLDTKKLSESKEAAHIAQLVNQAVAQTRDLSRLLHPLELESHGLISALQELASSTRKILGIKCNFLIKNVLDFSNKTCAMHLYRIAQESLDNAIKHSHATEITIEFKQNKKYFLLNIRDNGIGLSKKLKPGRGMGMTIMKHRASIIRANLIFSINKPTGTGILCQLPKVRVTPS